MSQEKANGLPSRVRGESFHFYMQRLYKHQRQTCPLDDANQYHVQAKLPQPVYRKFHKLLKKNGWSITTGVQYAIHQLTEQQS